MCLLQISPGKNQISPMLHKLRIHAKSLNDRYVDGTPTPAKIQISHFLKVGQLYIDVYSISIFKWENLFQISPWISVIIKTTDLSIGIP